jgi:biopolymer transport protein TolR
MAQVDSGGGRKNTNVDVNLVPFIDLMSVLITFLLITAVWSQVSMIQLGSSIYGKKTSEKQEPPPPMADIPLRLDVKDFGFRLIIGSEKYNFAKAGETAGLAAKLKEIKAKYPDKNDAVITVDDAVAYEFLVLGMDTLLQAKFPSLSVSTSGAE